MRKACLWVIAVPGICLSIAALFATLAPSIGRGDNPVGAVLGAAGLALSAWIGWYAHRIPLRDAAVGNATAISNARTHLRQRREALKIVAKIPASRSSCG